MVLSLCCTAFIYTVSECSREMIQEYIWNQRNKEKPKSLWEKNSQSFGEAYRSLDLSDASEKQLNGILSGKAVKQKPSIPRPQEVAKDIMKSYLAQQRQAQATRNAHQPVERICRSRSPSRRFSNNTS